jgi:Zn-finger nucleic acid-binding protein
VWFDANELGALAQTGQAAVGWAEQLFEPGVATEEVKAEGGLCPKCGIALYPFEFKHTPGVKLDGCPECRGIWVDDRELETIAVRMLERQKATERRGPGEPQAQRQGLRRRARSAVGLMQRFPCPACGEENPTSSLICWKCGTALRGKRGALMCPRCDCYLCSKPADLTDLDVGDARVDHCEDCGGIWLDLDALSVLVTLSMDWLERWQHHLVAACRHTHAGHADHLLCPVCQISLEERIFGEQTDLYVDRCTACRGTWLDRGELVLVKRISVEQDVWRNAD